MCTDHDIPDENHSMPVRLLSLHSMLTAILYVRGTFLGTHCGPLAPRNGILPFIVNFRLAKEPDCNFAARCLTSSITLTLLRRSRTSAIRVNSANPWKPSAIFWPAPVSEAEALMPSTRLVALAPFNWR